MQNLKTDLSSGFMNRTGDDFVIFGLRMTIIAALWHDCTAQHTNTALKVTRTGIALELASEFLDTKPTEVYGTRKEYLNKEKPPVGA